MRKPTKKNKATSLVNSAKAGTRAGEAATASGMNFYAAVIAIAVIHFGNAPYFRSFGGSRPLPGSGRSFICMGSL